MYNLKYFIMLFSMFIAGVAVAQTRDKLDKANGFKSIQLGSPQSQWEKELTKTKSGKYRYTGTCCRGAFGSSVDKITLQFDSSSKVSGVYVSISRFMGKSSINSYKKIIALNYGKEDKFLETKDDLKYFWHSDKMVLELRAWENGDTWDAQLKYTTPSQFILDSSMQLTAAQPAP